MKIAVISPKKVTQSATRLAQLLSATHINHQEIPDLSGFDLVFNYGSSKEINHPNIINSPHAVSLCINKISTLKRLEPVCSSISWTKDREKALAWFCEDGVVVARESQTGSQGKGLTYAEDRVTFDNAPASFWTRFFPHEKEVRINVFKGTILSIFDKQIKELGDGHYEFDFVPLTIAGEHDQISLMISQISKTLGIDYYGMDVLVNGNNFCKLLEVNSGPILHPETEAKLIKLILES